MNTINEKTHCECDLENATAEIELFNDQLSESDQSTVDAPDSGENLVPNPEKVTDLVTEIPVSVSIAEFITLELEQLREQLLHIQVDFHSYRKRAAHDQDHLRHFVCTGLIGELLPIFDNFELGRRLAPEHSNILSRFQMILTQLQTFLTSKGVKEIATQSESFNSQWEEIVAYVYNRDVLQEQVVQTIQKGYFLSDRLLYAASVVVSKGA
jgi:molecular chaperone GrpE